MIRPPTSLRRKSSSSSSWPFTLGAGARRMASTASENMVARRRSRASEGLALVVLTVAADSMAWEGGWWIGKLLTHSLTRTSTLI